MAKKPVRPAAKKNTSQRRDQRRPASTSTRRSTSPRQSTNRQASTPRSAKAAPPPPIIREPLSPRQKLSISGIALLAIGLLLLLSLLTSFSGSFTRPLADFLSKHIGWGAYFLPLILALTGLWFLVSNLQYIPSVSVVRVLGILLLFFNIITWFEAIGSWLSPPRNGGGNFGAAIYGLLERGLGGVGALLILVAWLLVALVLLVNLSLSALTLRVSRWFADFQSRTRASMREAAQQRAETRDLSTPIQAAPPLPSPETPAQQATQAVPVPSTPAAELEHSLAPEEPQTWQLPQADQILSPVEDAPIDTESDEDRARVIEETLRSFGTPAHVVEIRRGPTVTMFGVQPDFIESRSGRMRVRVNKITSLADDLSLALKAPRIRMQAPVPGKDYVGVEVPNSKLALVSLLEIVESASFRQKDSKLRFALGKDVSGAPTTADLVQMPHLLIAGTTGSGKSVCVNAILASLLLALTPDELRLVLVDPKRVELTNYNGIPHLLAPVITDAEKVVNALQWMLRQMDMRYQLFNKAHVRDLPGYNAQQEALGAKKLPYIVMVIDELADLMMLAPDDTERSIARLAQLARATGIHLILATQRPSTDILTGVIKANFSARIAFAVASGVDSRVILDQPGAEHLLGKGDMLFQAPNAPAPVRLQGTFVSDFEINALTDFWRLQNNRSTAKAEAGSVETEDGETDENPPLEAALYAPAHPLPLTQQDPLWQELERDPDEDPITREAIAIFRKEGRASVTMLQKKLRIGYTRAARLVDKLAERGIIGEADPQTGSREVLDYGDYQGPVNDALI